MLVELAETLQAPVSGGSFPSRHPLRQGGGGLIRNADLIVVLDDGEIVQSGRHAELMSIDGPYASLVSGQLESDGEETFPAAGKIRFRSA